MPTNENAHGVQDRGREELPQERRREHERKDDHAAVSPHLTPSFDEMQRYREADLDLIPLHKWDRKDPRGRDRGKSPIDPTWQRRTYSTDEVLKRAQRGGLNVGFRIPADVVVLDVDPRNFPDGRDSLAEVTAALGIDLSVAPHVVTGSGGDHYYFHKPADARTLDSLADFPGIEFKSQGRQVVVAGSVHPSGRRYLWDEFSPDLGDMPDLPPTALAAIRRPDRPAVGDREAGELTLRQLTGALEWLDPEDFKDEKAWRDLAMACHHATSGEGRQEFIEWSTQDPDYADHAWIIGNRWDSFHAAAPHGEKPVTVRLLHKLVQEAGGQVPNPDPEDEFEAWEDDGEPEPAPHKRRFLTVDELEALPPPKWLVPGLLTEGSLAAIYGAPESGKSFLAVDISMAIAGGLDWHGRTVERGGVLYVAAEGAAGLGKRVRAWKIAHLAGGRAFSLWLDRGEINLAAERDGGVRGFVREIVEELGPLRLVVIDTLNQTAAGADENSAKDMGRYIASMKRIRDETGAAVVVVHHSGKDAARGMRGSTAILGAMDTTVEVDRDKDRRAITVTVQKQKDAERELPMRFGLERVELPGDAEWNGKPPSSLVLRPTVMAEGAGGIDGETEPVVALAHRMAHEHGGSIALKELVEFLCSRDNVSDKTARRRIEEAIPKGRENAVAPFDGQCVWLEPVNSSNPKLGIVVRAEG